MGSFRRRYDVQDYGKCNGKHRYDKRGAISKVNYKRLFGTLLRAYQCSECNFWHVTSQLEIKRPEKVWGKRKYK